MDKDDMDPGDGSDPGEQEVVTWKIGGEIGASCVTPPVNQGPTGA